MTSPVREIRTIDEVLTSEEAQLAGTDRAARPSDDRRDPGGPAAVAVLGRCYRTPHSAAAAGQHNDAVGEILASEPARSQIADALKQPLAVIVGRAEKAARSSWLA